MKIRTVLVELLDEATTCWISACGLKLGPGVYRILLPPRYEPLPDEIWAFPPGSVVRCTGLQGRDGEVFLAAVEEVAWPPERAKGNGEAEPDKEDVPANGHQEAEDSGKPFSHHRDGDTQATLRVFDAQEVDRIPCVSLEQPRFMRAVEETIPEGLSGRWQVGGNSRGTEAFVQIDSFGSRLQEEDVCAIVEGEELFPQLLSGAEWFENVRLSSCTRSVELGIHRSLYHYVTCERSVLETLAGKFRKTELVCPPRESRNTIMERENAICARDWVCPARIPMNHECRVTVDNLLAESVVPRLKEEGFRKDRQRWNRRRGLLVDILQVEHAPWSVPEGPAFRLIAAVFVPQFHVVVWGEMGEKLIDMDSCPRDLMIRVEPPEDEWWSVTSDIDVSEVQAQIGSRAWEVAFPFWEEYQTVEDVCRTLCKERRPKRKRWLDQLHTAMAAHVLGEDDLCREFLESVARLGPGCEEYAQRVMSQLDNLSR